MDAEKKSVPHVLVVEDDPHLREVVGDRLGYKNIPYLESPDFKGAKDILDSGQRISLVLSDGMYPGDEEFPAFGSMSLLRHMHKNGMMARIPVVMMSLSPDSIKREMKKLTVMQGMDGFAPPEIYSKDNMREVYGAVTHKLGLPTEPLRTTSDKPSQYSKPQMNG